MLVPATYISKGYRYVKSGYPKQAFHFSDFFLPQGGGIDFSKEKNGKLDSTVFV